MTKGLKKNGVEPRLHRPAAAAAEAILRRPEVRALARLARRRREQVWLAGGVTRDVLLGREVLDVDAVVSGSAEPLALALEKAGAGRCVALSLEEPRVFRIARADRELDLAELTGGSIEMDLGRRDFTVNAIALDLVTLAWTDPFGGARDLAAGRLRMISAENLADDPLRALRAARLMASHGLSPEPATSRACRRAAPGLSAVAPERIRSELVKLLEAPRVAPALRWSLRNQVLAPALSLPPGQASRLGRRLVTLDDAAVRRLEPESRRRLRLCLLCDGLGIPASEEARWLAARRFGRAEAGDVAALLSLARNAPRDGNARDEWAWVHDAGPLGPEAARLLGLLFRNERPLAARLSRRSRRPPVRARVAGADVLAWLGIPPGPQVGRLLREVRIEILRGAVRTRREARKWLQARM